jgi:flagellar biosynthesis GTPase FlhF
MKENHLSMGAINEDTNEYEPPFSANKKNKYKCPSCEKKVIIKQGKIKKHHFAHSKSITPCSYYDRPSEHEKHKAAKSFMKYLLDHKKHIIIYRICNYCVDPEDGEIITCEEFTESVYGENIEAKKEHPFIFNSSNKKADVALVENGNIVKYIFEIYYTHKTKEEDRPEPWFEINAEDLLLISTDTVEIELLCIRDYKCEACEFREELKRKENEEKWEQERLEEEERRKRREEQQEKERLEEEERRKRREKIVEQQRMEEQNYQQKWKEMMCETIEESREEKQKQNTPCNCGIIIKNICFCENPNYKTNHLSKNLYCLNCNKWKCRC